MAIAFRDSVSASSLSSSVSSINMPLPGCAVVTVQGKAASNNAGGGTTITCTLPTGRATNHVLVLGITVRGGTGTTITLPQNSAAEVWTLLNRTNSTTVLGQATYWKLATATDVSDASVNVTITSNKASAVVYAISGADTGSPASAQYGGQANASSLTISYAALGTWTSADGLSLLFGGMAYGGNTVGTSTNYTNDANSSSTSGGASSRTQTHGSSRGLSAVTTVGTLSETWTGTAGVNIGSQVFILQQQNTTTVVDGDVMVLCIQLGSNTRPTLSTPSGWTFLTSADSTAGNVTRHALYWKVAASEPTVFTVSWTVSTAVAIATLIAYSGASVSTPGSSQYGFFGDASSVTSHPAPSLGTWTSSDGIDLVVYSQYGSVGTVTKDGTYTTPTNWGGQLGTTASYIAMFYRIYTGVTTVGTISATTSTCVAMSAHCFILAAAGAAAEDPMPYVNAGYYA